MASLDDILTTQKNGVVSINGLTTAITRYLGYRTSDPITASTLVYAGAGRLASYSIIVAGSTDGFIYDSATTALAAASNLMAAIPKPSTTADAPVPGIGVFQAGMFFTDGLVVIPGTGQTVAVTYYAGV